MPTTTSDSSNVAIDFIKLLGAIALGILSFLTYEIAIIEGLIGI